jgi:hypothetical protein
MKLAPGNEVVPFSTVDVDGDPVSLEKFRGRPLLLMFFRGKDIGDHLSLAEIETALAGLSVTTPTRLRPA